MSGHPWFKFWATDYLCDPKVDALPLEAQGLLVRMWCVLNQRGSIPDNSEEIARLTQCKLQSVLHCHSQCRSFFRLQDGKLYSARMEAEQAKSEAARVNASKRYDRGTYRNPIANGTANGSANGSAKSPAQKARRPESRGRTNRKYFCAER